VTNMPDRSLEMPPPVAAAPLVVGRSGETFSEAVHADLKAIFEGAPDLGPQGPAAARRGFNAVQRFAAGPDGRLRLVQAARRSAGGGWRGRLGRRKSAPDVAGELVYAVGDIHGCYDLLREMVGRIADDVTARRPSRRPVVVFCGDYIDRGPDSAKVLEALDWLQQRAGWDVCLLKGNHEAGLLRFIDQPFEGAAWLQFGGGETLAAYGVDAPAAGDAFDALGRARDELLKRMPASHLRLLQKLDLMVVIGDYAFVHAGVAPGTALERQTEADLLWIRGEFLEASKPAGKVVVHGHSWVGDQPVLLDHRIGIDTGAYETGVLTAVRISHGELVPLQVWNPDRPAPGPRPPVEAGGKVLVRSPADFATVLGELTIVRSPADRPRRQGRSA
jgi:serine/threonine protein phosphatase 1